MVAGVPLFHFGVVADVQYANKPDSGIEGRAQHYGSAVRKLNKALGHFNAKKGEVEFVLSLGDCIDGNETDEKSMQDFLQVAEAFDTSEISTHHVIGNHCLRVPREALKKRLGIPAANHYSKAIADGWMLIVLDTTELSLHSQYPEDSQQMTESKQWHEAHQNDVNSARWNGGITDAQYSWLCRELESAAAEKKLCIVASHHPIGQGSGRDTHHAWNCERVATAVQDSGCVAAVFSGHDHVGGYAEVNNVHYVVVEAILEAPEDSNAYGFVTVYDDKLVINGQGTVTSRTCVLKQKNTLLRGDGAAA